MDLLLHLCFSTNKAAIATVWKKGEESTTAAKKALYLQRPPSQSLYIMCHATANKKKAPKNLSFGKLFSCTPILMWRFFTICPCLGPGGWQCCVFPMIHCRLDLGKFWGHKFYPIRAYFWSPLVRLNCHIHLKPPFKTVGLGQFKEHCFESWLPDSILVLNHSWGVKSLHMKNEWVLYWYHFMQNPFETQTNSLNFENWKARFTKWLVVCQ